MNYTGKTIERVATFVNTSFDTLRKLETIVQASEQNPELYLYAPLAAHDISITVVFYNII